jgi:hypothetical protein
MTIMDSLGNKIIHETRRLLYVMIYGYVGITFVLAVFFKIFADVYVIGICKQLSVFIASPKNSVVELEVPNHSDDAQFLCILLG